jgi:hypothetical protein
MTATLLEAANEALRNAVRDRLEATPADDPKMRGYTPPLAGCQPAKECAAQVLADAWRDEGCCDGGRCQPKTIDSEDLRAFADRYFRQTGDGVMGEATTVAEQTLQSALEAVRDRHTKYGPPNEHFARTAAMVNAAFGTTFSAADWALVMVLDKVARLRGPTPTTDGGVDIAGYGGCYEECRSRG